MEDYSILFFKKINIILLNSKNLNSYYKQNLINVLFHIYYININYYQNINLALKLCDKISILYNELVINTQLNLQSLYFLKINIIYINNFIYDNIINDICIDKINNKDLFVYLNIFKNIYLLIFNEKIEADFQINKYIIKIHKKIINNREINKIFYLLENIFSNKNINLKEKLNLLIKKL